MTTHPFDAVTTPQRWGDGQYFITPTDDWFQGRGAYGGVTGAALARALQASLERPERSLRSLTVHFAAPVKAERADIATTIEREGSFVSHASARMTQSGKTAAFCTATFGAPRGVPLKYSDLSTSVSGSTRAPLDVPPVRDVARVTGSGLMPAFTQHYDFRFCLGHMPFSDAPQARLGGYLRADPPRVVDVPLVIGLIDAWPPSMITRLDNFNKGAASIDFTVHFYRDFPLTGASADDYFLFDVHSHWCEAGYAEEHTQMYAPDGELVAECRQMIALF